MTTSFRWLLWVLAVGKSASWGDHSVLKNYVSHVYTIFCFLCMFCATEGISCSLVNSLSHVYTVVRSLLQYSMVSIVDMMALELQVLERLTHQTAKCLSFPDNFVTFSVFSKISHRFGTPDSYHCLHSWSWGSSCTAPIFQYWEHWTWRHNTVLPRGVLVFCVGCRWLYGCAC